MRLQADQTTSIEDRRAPNSSRKSYTHIDLQESIRSFVKGGRQVATSPTNNDIDNICQKSDALREMEKIVKAVFTIIRFRNPFSLNNISPEDFLFFIESQSEAYLEQFGIDLCREVAEPILKMQYMPFTTKSTFFDFYELCKGRKERDREQYRFSVKECSPKNMGKSLKEMLRDIDLKC